MVSRKDNFKALFSNSRTRTILLFTFIILLLFVIIGVIELERDRSPGPAANVDVGRAPAGIRAVPGALDPTAQYAKLQAQQNIIQAEQAIKTGTSAIPTIIRTQAIGQGAAPVGIVGGVGFEALSREDQLSAKQRQWLEDLRRDDCSKATAARIINEGASLKLLKQVCTCAQLKDNGYALNDLEQVCSCPELKAAGFNARQLKDAAYSSSRLRRCGFDACELRNAGFSAQEMKNGGFSDGELKGAGFPQDEIDKATTLPEGIELGAVCRVSCTDTDEIIKLREAKVSAIMMRRIKGCSISLLKDAGYTAKSLSYAGYSPAELKKTTFTPQQLKEAGFLASDLLYAGFNTKDLESINYSAAEIKVAVANKPPVLPNRPASCDVDALKKAKESGVSISEIRDSLGCSPNALKLAGHPAKALKQAGFTAAELKQIGFSLNALKEANFNADEMREACYTLKQLKDAGYGDDELRVAGFDVPVVVEPVQVVQQPTVLPPVATTQPPVVATVTAEQPTDDQKQLQAILERQRDQMDDQQYQQKIQQRASDMLSAANQSLQEWKQVAIQEFVAGVKPVTPVVAKDAVTTVGPVGAENRVILDSNRVSGGAQSVIKAGDIVFAVLDTTVDSDHPSPILATIVSGPLKGSKLIGSFTLPSNGDRVVITFNTLSIPGAPSTTSINAYAIDPNTAQTALSSRTNHHYLMRYGALFASSFMEGIGNAFQSANTRVSIGGTGGGDNIEIQEGIDRSTLDNAIIALSAVGKAWGQQAQQIFNTPPTVQVCSGTGVGILFMQDLTLV